MFSALKKRNTFRKKNYFILISLLSSWYQIIVVFAGRTFDNLQKQPPRQFSKISVLFFQEQPFYNFPGGYICSSNRHEFSRRVNLFVEQTRIFQEGLYVLRTDTNFQGGLFEKTCFFKEVLSVRRTDLIISSNRY